MNSIFCAADILLPKAEVPLQTWAALACDQFTSQPEYWRQAEALAKDVPSTLHITLPEVYLEQPDVAQRIESIHATMQNYEQDAFAPPVHGFVYVERTTQSGVRCGLVGTVDLEQYSYEAGAAPLIRPSENTVVERIPPRLAVRSGAALETPHILMLLDDAAHSLIEPFAEIKHSLQKLYETPLMLEGGSVAGWAVTQPQSIEAIQRTVCAAAAQSAFDAAYPEAAGKAPLALAVGDGNHSLATAKAYWQALKQSGAADTHPARYALVELVNVHSPAILIEPIHRAVFGTDLATFSAAFEAFLTRSTAAQSDAPQPFVLLGAQGKEQSLAADRPPHPLAVGTLELFLAEFCAVHPSVKVDYIHGEAALRELAQQGAVGVQLPPFAKSDLFRGVVLGGVLPKKTFSMGEATEKRYYMECRKIAL